jgi:hypothetical protein
VFPMFPASFYCQFICCCCLLTVSCLLPVVNTPLPPDLVGDLLLLASPDVSALICVVFGHAVVVP